MKSFGVKTNSPHSKVAVAGQAFVPSAAFGVATKADRGISESAP